MDWLCKLLKGRPSNGSVTTPPQERQPLTGEEFPPIAGSTYQPRFVRVRDLKKWGKIKRHQDIEPAQFCCSGRAMAFTRYGLRGYGLPDWVQNSNILGPDVVHFISHRWLSPGDPDPKGDKFALLAETFSDDALLWMDYMCLPQQPRSTDEQDVFRAGIQSVPDLIRHSWFCAIDAEREDYKIRAWCQFEAMCAIRFQSLPTTNTLPQEDIDRIGTVGGMLSVTSVSPLSSLYMKCREALPKDRLPPGGEHIGSGFTRRGYYIDVPDLNDAAFAELKGEFEGMAVADEHDRPLLWENLRRIFPARRLDFTSEHP